MRKISRFYKDGIMQNLWLFIALGLLNVLFSEHGWFPMENMQGMITGLYEVVIPVFLAYSCGKLSGGEAGAAVSTIAMLGVVGQKETYSIFIAMLVSPPLGLLTKKLYGAVEERIPSGFEMLAKNLFIGVLGVGSLLAVRVTVAAAAVRLYGFIYQLSSYLASHRMMGALCVIVEPLKVLFLNNSVNHGILTPLGIEQMKEFGKSLFFLVEANPGAGLGILLARLCFHREDSKKYVTYALIESVGGIHEIYFPYVLARPALLLAAIAGSVSGMAVFGAAGVGLVGAVSPGSILLCVLLAAKGDVVWILLGIAVSAIVSFGLSFLILKWSKREKKTGEQKEEMGMEKKEKPKKPERIYFVCDAGFGSSAMAASLFRKKLKKEQVEGISVEHTAIDKIPKDADIVFAQKSFEAHLKDRQENTAYYFLESIMQADVFEELIQEWKKE